MDPLFALLATNIGISILSRWGPSTYNVSHNWLYKISSYYKCIPADNKNMIIAILTWLCYYSHQIKGKGVVVWRYKYSDDYELTIQLPPFNKDYPIKTKHGIIYVKIISPLNGQISAIELIVDEPCLWFRKDAIKKSQNLLNYYIYMFSSMSGSISVSGELRDIYEPEVIYEKDEICKRHVDEYLWMKMVKLNKKLLEKKDEYVIYPEINLNKKIFDTNDYLSTNNSIIVAHENASSYNNNVDTFSVDSMTSYNNLDGENIKNDAMYNIPLDDSNNLGSETII